MAKATFGRFLIRKRTASCWLALYIFIMPFLLSFLIDFCKLPDVIKYTVDLAWIAVFMALFLKKRFTLNKSVTVYATLIGMLFLYVLLVYIFKFQSVFYFLWGIRNNFRFYIAFLGFATLFDSDDLSTCMRFIDLMFWVNAAVSFVQFFVLGYNQDFLGGVFGVGRGCNAYSIIFFSFVISKSVLLYMNKKESALSCILKCGVTLLISALAELKVFFVIFAIIMILAALLTAFSARKLVLILTAFVLVALSTSILTNVFGSGSNLTFGRLIELVTATNYATEEDLGRFTAIPTIADTILTSIPDQIFGMGLGNCETSGFEICNTPFFKANADLHYTWFSSAFLFLEMGYIGLLANLSIFALVFFMARKKLKSGIGDPLYCQLGIIFSIICFILTFYNSSLRMEVGYVAYFALALPFVRSGVDRE